MLYRKFGNDGWKISALGFGAMRLPMGENSSNVDVEKSIELIRHGIDRGINYIDTAYIYHGGKSEGIVAKALKDGYRQKVRIATKSPGHLITTADDFERILDEQLTRLTESYVDYYLFHGIGKRGFEQIRTLKLFDRMEHALGDGRIRHIGFSFHDNFDAFKQIVDGYDQWEFCQIQYNYMDINNQAGTAGLRYAAARGLPVIIMEPLLGGRLANVPKEAGSLFASANAGLTPAAWALRWILDHPEVSTVLSGMNTFEQLDENIEITSHMNPGTLSEAEHEAIKSVRRTLESRAAIPCTECRYCMPCPAGVEIPWNLTQYNAGLMYGDMGAPRWVYENQMNHTQRAASCTQCGLCAKKCPQSIRIPEWMGKIDAALRA